MLSKCANPDCSASFLYLRQGKLFRFEVESREQVKLTPGPDGSAAKPLSRTEYFWLCDSCLRRMTLVQNADTGIEAVPLLSLKAAS